MKQKQMAANLRLVLKAMIVDNELDQAAYNALEQAIDQLRWRSVEDELPEMIGDCLVVYVDDVNGFTNIAWGFFNSKKKWFAENERVYPTHWKPLPEQP